jgi:hypothetical protein
MAKDLKAYINRLEKEETEEKSRDAAKIQQQVAAQEVFAKEAEKALLKAKEAAERISLPEGWHVQFSVEGQPLPKSPTATLSLSGPRGTREATFAHRRLTTRYSVSFPAEGKGKAWGAGPYPLGEIAALIESLVEAMISDFY